MSGFRSHTKSPMALILVTSCMAVPADGDMEGTCRIEYFTCSEPNLQQLNKNHECVYIFPMGQQ